VIVVGNQHWQKQRAKEPNTRNMVSVLKIWSFVHLVWTRMDIVIGVKRRKPNWKPSNQSKRCQPDARPISAIKLLCNNCTQSFWTMNSSPLRCAVCGSVDVVVIKKGNVRGVKGKKDATTIGWIIHCTFNVHHCFVDWDCSYLLVHHPFQTLEPPSRCVDNIHNKHSWKKWHHCQGYENHTGISIFQRYFSNIPLAWQISIQFLGSSCLPWPFHFSGAFATGASHIGIPWKIVPKGFSNDFGFVGCGLQQPGQFSIRTERNQLCFIRIWRRGDFGNFLFSGLLFVTWHKTPSLPGHPGVYNIL